MTTLYEVLNELTGDDITKKFSPEEVQNISKEIAKRVKKKIGPSKYKKLESYVIKNKDNEDLKGLTTSLLGKLAWSSLSLAAGDISQSKQEVILGYKLSYGLHEKLSASKYDAEQALLDLYC
jgi:hypothetical protein